MSLGRWVAVVGMLLAHALAAATMFAGPDLGALAQPAAIALALAVVGGAIGRVLGGWTMRDAYREWALSRTGALASISVVTVVGFVVTPAGGFGIGLALVAGYLAARDPPRASDVAFLVVALEVVAGIAFHAKAWQESGLFAVPTLLLAVAFAAREAWDLSHLAAPDAASHAATRAAFLRVALLLFVGAVAAALVGAWLYGGGDAGWVPGGGARGILLAAVVAGTAGAVWVLARRRGAGPA